MAMALSRTILVQQCGARDWPPRQELEQNSCTLRRMTYSENEPARERTLVKNGPPVVRDFFERSPKRLRLLELGCGTGGNALAAARHGHAVLGVDSDPENIARMTERAREQELEIDGVVSDVATFDTTDRFDAVLLDGMVRPLDSVAEATALITRAQSFVEPGGHVLLADDPATMEVVDAAFPSDWRTTFENAGFRIFRREITRMPGRSVARE